MNIQSHITKKTDLLSNDSLSGFDGNLAQQHHDVYLQFYNFISEIKPQRILEIGTALGGFTIFLKKIIDELNFNTQIITFDITSRHTYDEIKKMGIDVRVEDIFGDYKTIPDNIKDFIQSDGITLVLCDGGDKIREFKLLSQYLKKGDMIMAHDYSPNQDYFNLFINKKIWNWLEIQDKDIEDACIQHNLKPFMQEEFNKVVWVCKIKESESIIENELKTMNQVTLVTGLWDIGRDKLQDGWSRSFQHYLNKLDDLLKIDCNLIIFGDSQLESYVKNKRNQNNTQFIIRDTNWFKNEFYEKIQQIRLNPEWFNQVGWLSESTQAKLDMYNPLVMSKVFLLNDAKLLDKFNSDYMFWIDAGLSNTVHPGYFTHDGILDKLPKYIDGFHFVCFPYETTTEIHGFEINAMNVYCKKNVNRVARGGFFGGKKDVIGDINSVYYQLLSETLSRNLMGTEESIFTIMTYLYPNLVSYSMINGDGLMWKFFEDIKDNNLSVLNDKEKFVSQNKNDITKVGLYVLTFNSPNQFETLIKSMMEYDSDFISKPKKFLLDNSTDLSTTPRYLELCEQYGFEHIKKDNIGIMGGRIFIAEHFNQTDLDFYYFFEDDMFFYPRNEVCKNGFNRYVSGLYKKSLEIIQKEGFDFLKLNYTEFFGDNGTQWAWYNVPQDFRQKHWVNKPTLPTMGYDPDAPKTKFNNIKTYKGLPYIDGEIFLCNWPIIMDKKGNYKCYLETRWAYPFEQTLMSHAYQEMIRGNLKPGLLLLTPTEHNRFEHYVAELRKEN